MDSFVDTITNLFSAENMSLSVLAGAVAAMWKEGDRKTRVLMVFGTAVAAFVVIALFRALFGI